jgi:hypothetical protein
LKPGRIAVSAVLDEAAELVVREVPGWAGLLALTALPLRFLEVHFLNRLLQLGDSATQYVNHLVSLSWLVAFALLPAIWGRAVYAHACALALSGSRSAAVPAARTALRLPIPALVSYAYAATVAELLLVLLGWTGIALPVLALFAGLAAATSYLQERPGPVASLLVPLRQARPLAPFVGLTAVFGLAVLLAWINLLALFRLGMWLASGTSGIDLSWWNVALGLDNRHFLLLVAAGAVTVVEPFWLAALVVAQRQARARESGEDLEAWFAEIRAHTDKEAAA